MESDIAVAAIHESLRGIFRPSCRSTARSSAQALATDSSTGSGWRDRGLSSHCRQRAQPPCSARDVPGDQDAGLQLTDRDDRNRQLIGQLRGVKRASRLTSDEDARVRQSTVYHSRTSSVVSGRRSASSSLRAGSALGPSRARKRSRLSHVAR
jgi:hypothetical protein